LLACSLARFRTSLLRARCRHCHPLHGHVRCWSPSLLPIPVDGSGQPLLSTELTSAPTAHVPIDKCREEAVLEGQNMSSLAISSEGILHTLRLTPSSPSFPLGARRRSALAPSCRAPQGHDQTPCEILYFTCGSRKSTKTPFCDGNLVRFWFRPVSSGFGERKGGIKIQYAMWLTASGARRLRGPLRLPRAREPV